MIFLPGNTPSLKNSRVNGKFRPKTVTKYLRSLNIQDYSVSQRTVKGYVRPPKPNLFRQYVGDYFANIQYPAILGFHFVRDSRRSCDFQNLLHCPLDMLTAHGYIEDDSMKYIFPVPFKINGQLYSIDKENPGTWIKILTDYELCDIKIV